MRFEHEQLILKWEAESAKLIKDALTDDMRVSEIKLNRLEVLATCINDLRECEVQINLTGP